MPKKIAVLARERQEEALRMAIGLTLMDDIVDVYVLDRKLKPTDKNSLNLEMMKELKMAAFTNCRENEGMRYVTVEEIARMLLDYDHILPY